MLTRVRPRLPLRLPRLRSLLHDARGVAAVEFAMIAPVMCMLYFGMSELSEAMMAQRRVSHAASTIGDLVAGSKQLYAADYSDIFSVATTEMGAFANTTLKLRLTSITAGASPALTPTVDWSEIPSGQSGLSPLAKGSTVSLPAGLMVSSGDNVLMAEGTYQYTSPVGYVIKNLLTFSPRFYLRPRSGSMVVDCTVSPTPAGC